MALTETTAYKYIMNIAEMANSIVQDIERGSNINETKEECDFPDDLKQVANNIENNVNNELNQPQGYIEKYLQAICILSGNTGAADPIPAKIIIAFVLASMTRFEIGAVELIHLTPAGSTQDEYFILFRRTTAAEVNTLKDINAWGEHVWFIQYNFSNLNIPFIHKASEDFKNKVQQSTVCQRIAYLPSSLYISNQDTINHLNNLSSAYATAFLKLQQNAHEVASRFFASSRTPLTIEDNAWLPDERFPSCILCHTPFDTIHRRHHCRQCGNIICGSCSKRKTIGSSILQRVCVTCKGT